MLCTAAPLFAETAPSATLIALDLQKLVDWPACIGVQLLIICCQALALDRAMMAFALRSIG